MSLPRRIPVLGGLILILVAVAGVGAGFEYLSRGTARASALAEPANMYVTNVTDSGFTVVWTTADPASGLLYVNGPKGKRLTAFDERDATGKMTPYKTHSVPVSSLEPSTAYTVTVVSNGKKYTLPGGSSTVSTGPRLDAGQTQFDPAYGDAATKDSKSPEGAVVMLTLNGGQVLSALVKPSGSWFIPLHHVRTQSLDSYVKSSEKTDMTIVVLYDNGETTVLADTDNDAPVPTITVGKTSDFRNYQSKRKQASAIALAVSPTKSAPAAVLGAQTASTPTVSPTPVIRLIAPVNGTALSSTKPFIRGAGYAAANVTLKLGKPVIETATVKIGTSGLFSYSPKKALPAGQQQVTMTTTDKTGKSVTLTSTFQIFKSGTQVLGSATDSAEVTETPTDTPAEETPTDTPAEETPTPEATTEGQPVPESGVPAPLLIMIAAAVILIGSGSLLYVAGLP